MDDTHCIVDIIRCFQKFFAHESCGRCAPCREGTARLYELITDIAEGRGTPAHLRLMEELGRVMTVAPLCGLGQTAAVPLLSCLKHFREEIEAHVFAGRCPTGVCKMGKTTVVA